MKVSAEERDGVTVLRLRGRLLGGPQCAECIAQAVREAGHEGTPRVLLDLGQVEIVNSGGLGILIVNHRWLKRQGGALKLLNVTKRVENVLMITDLITVFESYRNEDRALASFAA